MENNDIRQPNANDQEQIQTISLSSYLSQAKDFYHAKKYKKCLLYVSLYLKLHPFSFDALFLKGKTYIQLYQYNKSLVSISKAIYFCFNIFATSLFKSILLHTILPF